MGWQGWNEDSLTGETKPSLRFGAGGLHHSLAFSFRACVPEDSTPDAVRGMHEEGSLG